ncbi:hypothetical protein [Micromonospora aurantiaca]|uniref:DUF4012 domain-containing protein n=1 Tax=Micromonospora aurantiaca (nom. illeg.) TaxID=47850 RepID=A0ABQ6UBN2_9ACTN|nr:hypothetical protein [Micromonospora aurantiaca]KAB1108218.1 hypothetical protein F6X54_23350 [Micromonospora aurantiaca]UFN95652.1 hypothetical protein LF814_05695 [Micromonospora aurantiaca]
MSGRWWSQPFAPEGSAAAEGIVKQLGRPALDPLTVLVREAAQNSWDARLSDGLVEFGIDVRVLGDDIGAWRSLLLPGPAAESDPDLDVALRADAAVLVVSDRHTRGLGGPLRAGKRASDGATPDFVQFLRNVGEPSDHQFGGGTYGFGKGIFYRLSRVGSILVDTNTAAGGPTGRRLMGAALGHSWYLGDRRFTGRHWWGQVAADDVPDPLLNGDAEAVADALGLPGFADGRTGTDIVILVANLGPAGPEPDSRERTPAEAATFITSSILWNLWPKMIPGEHGSQMRFTVGVNGSSVPVPAPDTVDDLVPFVEALQDVRAGRGVSYSRTVPPRNAGSFAMALGAADGGSRRLSATAARPFDGPSHHVARMRVAELVVDYMPGPAHPDSRLSYGAVFKASEDADELFAQSEPPTHDDWIPKGLSGSARGVVLGARTFVNKQLDEKLGLVPQAGGSGGQGLGELSAMLAGIVPARLDATHGAGGPASGGSGPVVGPRSASGGGSPGPTRAQRGGKARLTGAPSLRIHQDYPYLVAQVKVPADSQTRIVTADVEVVVEGGGRESEPPLGAVLPQVMQWQSANGDVIQGRSIQVPPGEESDWYVYSTYLPDAVVRFRVSQVASSAS